MKKSLKKLFLMGAIFILTATTLNPIVTSTNPLNVEGFDKGPSNFPVVPLKKTTLVNFDKDSLIDDYAYLASIPSAAFHQDGKMYSYPLLYYQDLYVGEHEYERTLNARQGLDYFMEDWMGYCKGELDEMTLINVPKNKASQWDAKEYILIESDDPYEIAVDIALKEWSYCDEAVIAVTESEYKTLDEETKGTISGIVPSNTISKNQFKMQRPIIGTGATYESLEIINPTYKYILAQMSWRGKEDFDFQLYDPELGMVETAFTSYSDNYPFDELIGSYIYFQGDWEISVSAQAKKSAGDEMGEMESMCYYPTPTSTGISSILNSDTVDIETALLPGISQNLPAIPYGCRNIKLTLTWDDPNVDLGFTLIDPIGTEIDSSFSLDVAADKVFNDVQSSEHHKTEITMDLEKLGETGKDNNYSVCIFSIGDLYSDTSFSLEYQWTQKYSKEKGDGIESACNGAVLASSINAPLLYIGSDYLSDSIKQVLYKLGVKTLHIINLGNHLSKDIANDLSMICKTVKTYSNPLDIFNQIRDKTGKNDVIFATFEPWDYWYIADIIEDRRRESMGEWNDAYHFAQAAYCAAHHGSPVILVDNHPMLSQATTWATDWWHKNAHVRTNLPSAGAMTLTARRTYEFLEKNGFGKIEMGGPSTQDRETIITVAGQYDIGVPWDRSFTGAGLNGRFWGHPVDSAYTICRNIFYPAIIFENPAMNTVTLTQGSESTTKLIGGRLQKPLGSTLVITKPMQEETFEYPLLHSYCGFAYRYNEVGWKHFNCKYTRADGIIPWDTPSPHRIDDGVAHGKTGAYYPDISETEVIPFYCNKAGYDNVFSTSFKHMTDNLNKGVLFWSVVIHGHHENGGNLEVWDIESPYVLEENPWRGYEPIAWKLGNMDEYIRWFAYYIYHESVSKQGNEIPILDTISKIPIRPIEIIPERGSTENPDTAFLNQQIIFLGKMPEQTRNLISQISDPWGPWPFMIYRDRILHPFETVKQGLPFFNFAEGDGKVCHSPPTGGRLVGKKYYGIDFDNALENIHSVGVNSQSCLPAFTYLHLTWMRHGSVYQIIDPWTTTDWAGIWNQMLIKLYAMGYTVGEAYERGIRAVGPEYSCGQSWWDLWENICFVGDPNLRPFVPNTEYTDHQNGYEENHWTYDEVQPLYYDAELNINGHMPFGANTHPHEIQPSLFGDYFILVLAFISIIALLLIARFLPNKKR